MLAEPPLPATGTWSLRRRVLDRASGRSGRVRGTLAVTAEPGGGQRWSESGVLRWDGRDHPVVRVLLLQPDGDAGGGWWLRFADGRPFVPWRPGCEVEHPCAEDVYRGRIDVAPTQMAVRWDVSGPTKDQLLVSELSLVAAAP